MNRMMYIPSLDLPRDPRNFFILGLFMVTVMMSLRACAIVRSNSRILRAENIWVHGGSGFKPLSAENEVKYLLKLIN